ncbi:MAG: GlxA family transcriptional regulator [Myxococcota bacterium]
MLVHLLIDGVADGTFGVGVEVAAAAARLATERETVRALRQRIVSLDGRAVTSSAGRPVAVDGRLEVRGLGRRDVLIIPGLSGVATAPAIARLLTPRFVEALGVLRRAQARGVTLAASCSATFLLGAAGVLAGREATTTWWLAGDFARRFPGAALVGERMVVESGGVLTAGSAFAHADLMLAIVARVAGPSLAQLVARYLVLDQRSSQARYMVLDHLRTADPALERMEAAVRKDLSRQLTLGDLARAAGTSPRTLLRRTRAALGVTPLAFVHRLRVAHAAHLLETTDRSVEEIAGRVGYSDAAAFRRIFRRYEGRTPRELRPR